MHNLHKSVYCIIFIGFLSLRLGSIKYYKKLLQNNLTRAELNITDKDKYLHFVFNSYINTKLYVLNFNFNQLIE